MTDTAQSSSLAQLLALLGDNSGGMPNYGNTAGQTGGQPMSPQMQQYLMMRQLLNSGGGTNNAPIPSAMGGAPPAQMPVMGQPMAPGSMQMPSQVAAGAPGNMGAGQPPANMMAFLQSLDPATRARLMAQMGVNAAPMGMPASGGAMNADFLGTRG